MKRKKKRKRIARLRKEQKDKRKVKNSPYNDAKQLVNMAEKFVKSDTEFVEDYSLKSRRAKKKILTLSVISALSIAILYFEIDIGIHKIWVVLSFWSTFAASVMCFSTYSVYKSRIPFWEKELEGNTNFLNAAKDKMRKIEPA